MVLPPQYANLTLAQFLALVLKSYPDVKTALLKMGDASTPEHAGWHLLSTAAHTGVIQVKQRGKTYQLSRASNIRYTTSYQRYVLDYLHRDPLQEDEVSVAYRLFYERYDKWVTIPL